MIELTIVTTWILSAVLGMGFAGLSWAAAFLIDVYAPNLPDRVVEALFITWVCLVLILLGRGLAAPFLAI
ncbi:MAG: hypothetical protein AAFY65_13080 [Pseudomonadota bacterium]